jgi:hypothetical protein
LPIIWATKLGARFHHFLSTKSIRTFHFPGTSKKKYVWLHHAVLKTVVEQNFTRPNNCFELAFAFGPATQNFVNCRCYFSTMF